jgi:TolA-binding protein
MDAESAAPAGRTAVESPRRWLLRRLLRPKILASAASVAGIVMLAVVSQAGPSQAVAPAATSPGSDALPPADFGNAVPSDRFVHEFQKEVVQQLQSSLTQAGREQDERLQHYEQQTQQLQAQSDSLARSIQELQGRAEVPASGASSEAPRVNVRSAPERTPDAVSASIRQGGDRARRSATRSEDTSANLAPHGFADGRLLNGVVAIVGGAERESIVALQGPYESANGFRTDLDGCFALVQGRPELASGRIDFKVARLTCNFPDGASKTWDVAGWLVDPDGIRGVRARIVQNAGRKALAATAGGAISGFGRRLTTEQYQVNAGPLASSSTFIGNASRDALGGSAEGAAGALGQSIADYYNLYTPSLQVGGGALVSVVIANELKFPASGRNLTQTHAAQ